MKTLIKNDYLLNETKLLENKEAAYILFTLSGKGVTHKKALTDYLGLKIQEVDEYLTTLSDYGMIKIRNNKINVLAKGKKFLEILGFVKEKNAVTQEIDLNTAVFSEAVSVDLDLNTEIFTEAVSVDVNLNTEIFTEAVSVNLDLSTAAFSTVKFNEEISKQSEISIPSSQTTNYVRKGIEYQGKKVKNESEKTTGVDAPFSAAA